MSDEATKNETTETTEAPDAKAEETTQATAGESGAGEAQAKPAADDFRDALSNLSAAIDRFGSRGPATILDLGTGPGTLLLAALDQWPQARGLGIDRSEDALAYARRNAARLGLGDRTELRLGDWGEGIEGRFDLVLANPPYVAADADLPPDVADHEPAAALFAGADGLDDYRRLAPQLPRLIAPGGVACVEIGAGQKQAVAALFGAAGLRVASRDDLAGVARCLVLANADE